MLLSYINRSLKIRDLDLDFMLLSDIDRSLHTRDPIKDD